MITRAKKKEPKSHIFRLRWRRVWDSNPRDVAVKQFSRKLGFVTDSPY